ncbi:MAG: flagellar filament capping protein FliD [Nocardioidaceae bacterium]|nr:flagellar filament capping protein FliD [Nocardioidaceae bacterium]
MAGTTSVGGLVSGLDTATIISQLMQVEAQTQTRIKTQLSTAQSTLTSVKDLNAKLASLTTSAADLAKTTSWNPVTVTSSSTLVSVTPGSNAVAGPLTFTVGHTALAHRLSFTSTAALTDVVTTGSTKVRLDRLDGTSVDLDTGDGTLRGLVAALNASGTGVKASTVRLDDGTYRLQVTSATTGAASDFTLTNLDGSALLGGAGVTAGRDAEITVGTDVLHSATNTFAGVANGLSITLKPSVPDGTVVDLDVVGDTAGMAAKVKGLVDAVNDALSKIDALSSYNTTTKTAGPLAGDAAVRAVRNALLNTVYPTDGTSLASAGVQLDRYGKLTFDADKFTAAYAADPSAVAAQLGTGFAGRVQAVAKGASDSVKGTVTTSINGRTSAIDRMQDSIADWDNRLAIRKDALTRQFTALETALSQMNSQSSWLSGQLAKLNSGGSS